MYIGGSNYPASVFANTEAGHLRDELRDLTVLTYVMGADSQLDRMTLRHALSMLAGLRSTCSSIRVSLCLCPDCLDARSDDLISFPACCGAPHCVGCIQHRAELDYAQAPDFFGAMITQPSQYAWHHVRVWSFYAVWRQEQVFGNEHETATAFRKFQQALHQFQDEMGDQAPSMDDFHKTPAYLGLPTHAQVIEGAVDVPLPGTVTFTETELLSQPHVDNLMSLPSMLEDRFEWSSARFDYIFGPWTKNW